MDNILVDKLESLIEGDVSVDAKTLKEHARDTSLFEVMPEVVVFPKNAEDISRLVRFVNEHPDSKLSLTARSAGTDMTGGPLNTSIIIDFARYFNEFLGIKNGWARTQPGVFYRDFEKETLKQNLLLPCYTASRELNTVGGMVANNSGGEKSLTYGKTNRYIRELKMILHDGNEYTFKKLTFSELREKKRQQDFEGELYRSVQRLILENREVIESAKPHVTKNSAGYYLWDVMDFKRETFDMTQLLVGSQGTLGMITEITFDLVTPKKHSRILAIFLKKKHMPVLGELVNEVLKSKPESFESYDDHTFGVILKIFPKFVKKMKGGLISLGLQFLPEVKAILTGGIPKLVLIAEFTGDTDEDVVRQARQAQKSIASYGLQTHITRNEAESSKYWTIRRESFALLREHVKNKQTAPFIDDMAVRPEQLPEFLPKLYAILDAYDFTYTIAGHAGDANLHVIPLMDLADPQTKVLIKEISKKVYTLITEFNGTITGEHNDGLIRTPFLSQMYGGEVVQLFKQVKDIFDPKRIFNPGKKVEGDIDFAWEHMRKD